MSKIVIGITDCAKYTNYARWIEEAGDTEVIRLASDPQDIRHCQAVILTGGQDVHPRHYGREDYLPYSDPADLAEERDEFELTVIGMALKAGMPFLGICRGLQVTNVYLKGTLIPDLPSWGKFNHSRVDAQTDRLHPIVPDENSLLASIIGPTEDKLWKVNSAHHQSADRIGNGLVVSAMAPDGTIECMEWQKQTESFFLLVQWHPERMADRNENPYSYAIRKAFLDSAARFTPGYRSA